MERSLWEFDRKSELLDYGDVRTETKMQRAAERTSFPRERRN